MKHELVGRYTQIKPDCAWSWSDDDETNLKVMQLIAKDVDLGAHTKSKIHKLSVIRKIAKVIGSVCENVNDQCDMVAEDPYETDELRQAAYAKVNKRIDQRITHGFNITCGFCDQVLNLYLSDDGVLRPDPETIEHMKDECFEFKNYQFEIKTKSNQYVIANSLIDKFKTNIRDHLRDCDINALQGSVEAVRRYAKDGVICPYVGNTSIAVSKTESGDYYFHENYRYDPETDEFTDIELHQVEQLGAICCDLWWIMGADVTDVDMDKVIESGYDYILIDVEPNTTYILDYDMSEGEIDGKCFKFSKKLE